MRLYKRNVQVIIGDDNSQAPELIRRNNTAIAIPADATKDQLRIKFSVMTNQSSALPSDNFIKIYNLKDTTQSFIKERGVRVRLLAGYDGNLSIIYDGTIAQVDIKRKDVDNVTKITLANKTFTITDAVFSKSYAGLVSTKTIVKDAIAEYANGGLTYQYLDLIPDFQHVNFSFDGRTKDLLDKLLLPIGILWYVDGSVVKFTKEGAADQQDAVLLSKDTGMILSPVKTDKGINVKSLLNAKIALSKNIEIQSSASSNTLDGRRTNQLQEEYNGVYKVISIKHHGESIDGEMVTEIECVLA